MSQRPDVVVIGFGLAGAVAGLEAAAAGARVVALSRRHVDGQAQAQARAAGVEVRVGAAHELDVEGGRVVGVGYGLPARDVAGCPFCDCADPVWSCHEATAYIGCSAVVLAVDAGHWDFVGTAVWSAVRGRWAGRASGAAGRLTVLRTPERSPEPAAPELVTRRWCAEREAGPVVAVSQTPLQVDDSGAVRVECDWPVVGLYSAVPARPGQGDPPDAGSARRAGRAAARSPAIAGRAVLRSVG